MSKKLVLLISFILLFSLTGNGRAVTFSWDNGGESNLWNVPENWEPDGLPTDADEARIEDPNESCLIDSSIAAECSMVTINSNSRLDSLR